MTKLYSLGLALLMALTVSGCQLYFGDESNNDDAYCATDGYYVRGEWVSAQCPGGGNACASNRDCAAACLCNLETGVCEETGFCSDASDCAAGYECDERSSCVPSDGGSCAAPIDEATCTNGAPKCPVGSVPLVKDGCYYDAADDGQFDCMAISECAVAPSCEARQHQVDCVAGSECSVISRGVNCATGTGQPCTGGQAGCICESYVFDYCQSGDPQ